MSTLTRIDHQRFRISRGMPYTAPKYQYRGDSRQRFSKHPKYWKRCGCKDFGCGAYERGWEIKIDLSPFQNVEDMHLNQVRYNWIRDHSGLQFTERLIGCKVIFSFEAEQECFSEHKIAVERDPMFFHNRRRIDYNQFFDEFKETDHQLLRRVQSG